MNYRRLFIEGITVFLTVVTNNRKKILIDNIDILRDSFKQSKKHFNFEIIASVVMPDHFHVLLKPEKIEDYPKIIKSIKYNFSEKFDAVGLANPTYADKKGKGIWQRRYYEHTIIDDADLHRHIDYIHYNPVKHGLVQNVRDWEYSTFQKFVELKNYDIDWGSFDDIKTVVELNYE